MIDYAATFLNFTGAFPNIEAINVTAPGAGDGTEFVAAMVNDIWGRAQAMMDYAGLTPDGVQEAPDTAQILEAIGKGFGVGPGVGVTYWKNDTPAAFGDRVLLLTGQVIDITGVYSLLADAVWVGAGTNATAPAFYRTSDALGVTRDSGGNYMVLPDTRGLSLKNIGDATISARVKTGPVSLGSVQEDQMQLTTGVMDSFANSAAKFNMLNTTRANDMSGAFTISPANTTASNISVSASAIGTAADCRGFRFSSANSPDARASATTAGATRDSTIGTRFGITY